MSWLKRVTGMQELINEQRQTNYLLMEFLNSQKQKKPEGPAIKKYKK